MRQLSGTPLPAARPRGRRIDEPRLGRPWPRWLRVGVPRALLAVALCGTGLGGFWVWRSGALMTAYRTGLAAAMDGSSSLGLAVADVTIEGAIETSGDALLAALGARHGMPILALDLASAKARVEALPWVRKASIERRWPSLLVLRIEERNPLALWQHEGHLSVIDADGQTIAGADLRRFAGLPLVVGEGAPKQTASLLAMLAAQPDIAGHVSSAVWVGNRRWNLELDPGIELQLPESDPASALARFVALDRQQRLLARDVVVIDMRLPDRLIVRLAPSAVPPPAPVKGGKNT